MAQKPIDGFGHVLLGQYLPEVGQALDAQGIYHSFTGQAVIYETTANDDRWYVSAGIVNNHVSTITVSARKVVPGAPPPIVGMQECDRRYDRTLDVLRHEYGDETRVPHDDAPGLDDVIWARNDRSVSLTRHKIEDGCDILAVTYRDHASGERF